MSGQSTNTNHPKAFADAATNGCNPIRKSTIDGQQHQQHSHQRINSNVIYESTPEGDIRTIEHEPKDDFASFTARLKDSWDNDVDVAREEDGKMTKHKKDLSVQFLDISISGDPSQQLLGVGRCWGGGKGEDVTTSATTFDFEPPAPAAALLQREPTHLFANPSKLSSSSSSSSTTSAGSNGGGTTSTRTAPGLSYPLYNAAGIMTSSNIRDSPLSNSGIVVPTPIYAKSPPVPVAAPSPTDSSRKHRRELSARKPAMAHRRVNTKGESEAVVTKGHERDNSIVMTAIQERTTPTPPSPGTAMPPPLGPPPPGHTYPYYYRGSLASPQDVYSSNIPAPPAAGGTYYDSSPRSDAGASYNTGVALPAYTDPRYSLSAQSSPLGCYPGNIVGSMSFPPQQPNLGQPEQEEQPIYSEEMLFAKLKSGNEDGHDNHHRKQSSLSLGSYLVSGVGDSHHRKQSSLGSFLASAGIFEEDFEIDEGYNSAPDGAHGHKKSLSTMSFLGSLSNDDFLRDAAGDGEGAQLAAAAHIGGMYGPPPSLPGYSQPQPFLGDHAIQTQFVGGQATDLDGLTEDQRRNRRRCAIPNCPNRVVQGGLCISHGARRKLCSFPGCTKNVKKAGRCSAHGPPRKLCEVEGCVKVSVQGGRCISHGAKKNKFYIVALMFCTHSILSYDSLSITLCSYSHVQWKTVQNKQS
eukprot:g8148.t1.4.5e17418a g8148  g8148.t1 contig27:293670-295821(+)